jgi:hypothetical protein
VGPCFFAFGRWICAGEAAAEACCGKPADAWPSAVPWRGSIAAAYQQYVYERATTTEETLRLHMSLVALAFACNYRRTATIQWGDGTDGTVYEVPSNPERFRFNWICHRNQSDGSAGTPPEEEPPRRYAAKSRSYGTRANRGPNAAAAWSRWPARKAGPKRR